MTDEESQLERDQALAASFVGYVDKEFEANDVLMLSSEQEFLLEQAAFHLIHLIRHAKDPQLPQ